MNEPMKIFEAMDCYLPDVDGVVNCVHNYSLNLSEKADVTVVVPKNKRGYKDDFPYKVVRCTSMYIPVLKDHYGLPKFDKKFKKTLLNTDCDIIHVHSPFGMGKFALKIAKLKGVPIVGTFHSNMRTIFKSSAMGAYREEA